MRAIVVYGATGYTGRLISAALARRGADFAIAGRDAGKLEALARTLPDAREREMIVAPLDAPDALRRMARRGRVVLDCAGPFARLGRPVLDAALDAGAHFLDITGEHVWMRECLARDAEARAAGIAVVNGVGFDVIPTDIAAVLAAEAAGAPVRELRIGVITGSFQPTQGTTRSSVEAMRFGGLAWVNGHWRTEPIGKDVRTFQTKALGTRRAVSVPWGDVVTAPRSTGAQTVRVYMPFSRRMIRWAPLAQRALSWRAAAALAERFVRRLPEGPSAEERARGRFEAIAEADGATGTKSVSIRGGDGYDVTAETASLAAMLAAETGFTARGARTPTQAFGARRLLEGTRLTVGP